MTDARGDREQAAPSRRTGFRACLTLIPLSALASRGGRYVRSAGGTTRLRRQQEDEGHQTPYLDLLDGLRPGEPGHGGQRARHPGRGLLFDRAARNGWAPERIKADGIYVGARMEGSRAPRPRRPGHDPRAGRYGLQAAPAALAHRSNVRNADQSVATPVRTTAIGMPRNAADPGPLSR